MDTPLCPGTGKSFPSLQAVFEQLPKLPCRLTVHCPYHGKVQPQNGPHPPDDAARDVLSLSVQGCHLPIPDGHDQYNDSRINPLSSSTSTRWKSGCSCKNHACCPHPLPVKKYMLNILISPPRTDHFGTIGQNLHLKLMVFLRSHSQPALSHRRFLVEHAFAGTRCINQYFIKEFREISG